MEQVELYCQGVRCGEATLRDAGERVEICAQMEDPGDGLYRALLEGERGQLSLGVMEPKAGMLVLRRRPERCEIARIGPVQCVRAGCAFSFRKKRVWNMTQEPSELFRDEFLRSRLAPQRAWWRREQGKLTVALPLRTDAAFPLEALFCLARVERVENELCVTYVFDEQEIPVNREK